MKQLVLLLVSSLYLVILVAIGVFSFRKGGKSAEDYFMAGRSFGTVVLFMSMFATNVTAFALIGMPGVAYQAGIGVFGYFGAVGAFITPLTFILLGYPIWRLGKRHGYMTQAQMFGDRWQSPAVAYLLFGLLVLYTVPYLVIGLMGGGLAIETLSGGVVSYPLAAGIVAAITMLYTSLGGMRGTAWTNVFQGFIFLIFLAVACAAISSKLGGFAHVHERLVTEAPHLLGKEHPRLAPGIWATGFLVGPFSVIAFPHLFIRLMTAKNTLALKRSIYTYAWAMALLFIPITLIGVWGALDIPDLVGQESDRILPLLVEKHLPVWLGAIGLAAILAAVMSSLDGQILTISTMITIDLFARKGHQAMPTTGRIGVVLLAVGAFVVSLFRPAGIFDISVYAFSGYTLIVPVMAFGLFWRRSTAAGILVGSIIGHTLLAGYYLGWQFPTFGVFPVFVCLIVECLVVVLVSLRTEPPRDEIVRRFDDPFGRAITREPANEAKVFFDG